MRISFSFIGIDLKCFIIVCKKKKTIIQLQGCSKSNAIKENRHLHQPIVLYSFRVGWAPYNVVYIVSMYSLAIDINQLLVNLCQFHCYHLRNLFVVVLFERIVFLLYENHKYKYVVPVNSKNQRNKIKNN